MGNPLLCVSGLNCFKTSYVNPCVYKSTDHKVIGNVLVIIIRIYLHGNELKWAFYLKQMYLNKRGGGPSNSNVRTVMK